MHLAIACLSVILVIVSCRHQYQPSFESEAKGDYEYTQYDLELVEPSKNRRRLVRKIPDQKTRTTHRKIEIIINIPTTARATTEDRKLRYNEKVYLPLFHLHENTTVHPIHDMFKNNDSVQLMLPTKPYDKKTWTSSCQPLTGSAHPDGPLEYFDAIQAMRPPYFFPTSDEGPAFVKFFAEARYPVNDPSRLKKAMTKFLRCLLYVISHVPDDAKRKKITKIFFSSMIGWLKDSLLVDLYVMSNRPDQSIIEMENTVEALVYMRNKHFVPPVAKEALKTYEFISMGDYDSSLSEQKTSFHFTTAIMVTTAASFLFLLVILGACVAAALSSPALRQINELPTDFLPLQHRPSQLMDRSGRSLSLTQPYSAGVARPTGYHHQVRKLSVLPDSSIGAKVHRMSVMAQQEQLSPLLPSENGWTDGDDGTGRTAFTKDGSTSGGGPSKEGSTPR